MTNGTIDRAQAFHVQGRLSEAEALYREVLSGEPDAVPAMRGLGVVSLQLGRPVEAVAHFERGLAIRPRSPGLRANLAEALRVLGRHDEALEHARAALDLDPALPEAWNTLGLVAHDQGRHDDAEAAYREAIRLRPRLAAAHLNLGLTLAARRRWDQAIEALRSALRIEPDNILALTTLGKALLQAGDVERLDEAESTWRRVVQLRPDLPEAACNLGDVLHRRGRLDEALASYRRALASDSGPGRAAPLHQIGLLLQRRGEFDRAAWFYGEAHRLRPDPARYHADLGGLAAERDQDDEAVRQYRLALEHAPDFAEALDGLGQVLLDLGRHDEAEAWLREAMRIEPGLPFPRVSLARLQAERGDIESSCRSAREALALRPTLPEPYCRLALNLKGRMPDAEVESMRRLLDQKDLPDGARSSLHFALAAVLDARGLYAEAAESSDSANALQAAARKARGQDYCALRRSDFVDRMIDLFTAEFLVGRRGWVAADPRPVFVVGLPRSGTTLVEQVLASHPEVHGAGELADVYRIFEDLPALTGRPAADPIHALSLLDPTAARAASRRYLDRLDALAPPSASRVVDKMPSNFDLIGLIALLWPGARVIACRRDDRDVALSCWQTGFEALRWTNDPDDLAQFFADYEDLRDHWIEARPLEWLEVRYEDLVRDLEGQARRMIDFIGLEWDAACLEFHATRRVIQTASLVQARQPIHARSVGRWRHYEPYLQHVFRALERHGVGMSESDGTPVET